MMAAEDREKANVLSDFFCSVFTAEAPDRNNCIARWVEDNMHPVSVPFNHKPIEEEEVRKLLKDIDVTKAAGPDEIHPHKLRNEICRPLTLIFNSSLAAAMVLQKWKKANVTAIFKKGDKNKPCNYRPVSLTSILCKLVQILIRSRILEYLSNNNVSDI